MISDSAGTWRTDLFDQTKEEIKAELEEKDFPSERQAMSYLLKKLSALDDTPSPEGLMRRWVYMMHALLVQKRRAILPLHRVETLAMSGFKILKLQGIVPGSSRLDFLHGELRTVLSQIYSRAGRLEEAAWTQSLVKNSVRRSQKTEPDGTWYLAQANRLLRLGFAAAAIPEFERAVELLPSGKPNHTRALLGILSSLRLKCDWPSFEAHCIKMGDFFTENPRALQEVGWQKICSNVTRTSSISEMVEALKPSGTHHSADFFYEAYLWFACHKSEDQRKRADVLLRGGRGMLIKSKQNSPLLRIHEILQGTFKHTFDPQHVVERLADVAALRVLLPRVDLDLLVLGALTRCYREIGAKTQHQLAINLYHSLSRSLTDGATCDATGLFAETFQGIAAAS